MYILGNKTLNSEIRRGSFLMLAQTTVILTVAGGGTQNIRWRTHDSACNLSCYAQPQIREP